MAANRYSKDQLDRFYDNLDAKMTAREASKAAGVNVNTGVAKATAYWKTGKREYPAYLASPATPAKAPPKKTPKKKPAATKPASVNPKHAASASQMTLPLQTNPTAGTALAGGLVEVIAVAVSNGLMSTPISEQLAQSVKAQEAQTAALLGIATAVTALVTATETLTAELQDTTQAVEGHATQVESSMTELTDALTSALEPLQEQEQEQEQERTSTPEPAEVVHKDEAKPVAPTLAPLPARNGHPHRNGNENGHKNGTGISHRSPPPNLDAYQGIMDGNGNGIPDASEIDDETCTLIGRMRGEGSTLADIALQTELPVGIIGQVIRTDVAQEAYETTMDHLRLLNAE